MMYKHSFWLRASGLAGILGGLILFAGDMLIYYVPGSTSIHGNMTLVSDQRVVLSTLTAQIAMWFYLLGTFQLWLAFAPAPRLSRILATVSFVAVLSSYGVIHGHYMAIAETARLAAQHGLDIHAATALAWKSDHLLRLAVYPFFALLSVIFCYEVWRKRTLYPRWILPFFPLLPFALMGVFQRILTGDIRTVIIGGYLNLIVVLFFAASTVALWKHNDNTMIK
jgi:hypothetical protein